METYVQLGWVLPPVFERLKGIKKDMLDCRRKDGKIPEGHIWRKAPDGRVYYHFERWNEYVENTL
ncbi:hypothetical protein CBQ28_02290 [Pseudoalteromonas sp. GCY]|uniref:excisionase n=1 Tax=Pseudoalteromonas TaxID=53246 RepID=UPI000BFEDEBC|nr:MULTISPECIES: excisionase [unclassified Pseudoalteromonas]MCF2826801.1 hypothetical protein [Pseudoalteromonas sp. OF5H-5]MCF2833635.1 hypothetical protein [Pseudoalteromonas sp. DL2-H6]MCF2926673.1 hypothetical protein [Pseudoalteromonas sp. DL2-H1]NSY34695.1 excisionase [Pseudoalteromonas sp. JC28]PHI38860.1 hypothetical protein CBQ28_02290 [Pseudoalteromonas sp. GCY]